MIKKYNMADGIAAINKQLADHIYEAVVKPMLPAMIRALQARQPAYWHREKWWVR